MNNNLIYIKLKTDIIIKYFPYILFIFCLALYSSIILNFQDFHLIGDENRYIKHAQCISEGIFTPPDRDMWLWNGPGYPIVILPFVKLLKNPITSIRLLNALLLSLSTVIFYFTLLKVNSKKTSIIATLAFAGYILIWKSLPLIMTEILTIFLLVSIIYLIVDKKYSRNRVLLLAFLLSYCCMVKIVFGYIFFSIGLLLLIFEFFKRNVQSIKFLRKSFLISLLFCLPWLTYTYNKSGKLFYWGASGWLNLYWMSNPSPKELGEYMDFSFESALGVPGAKIGFQKSHGEEINRIINNFKYEKRDDEFKRVAFKNIKENPTAFIKNTWCNIGRFFFNYPYSYYPQQPSTLINIFINGPVIGFILLLLIHALFYFRRYPIELLIVIILSLFYMFINFPLSTHIRMFYVIIPLLFFWFAYVFDRINLKIERE
jgi:4-amino-4-deoxy-L-arabinose transferase-like glycosyltransferase